ncbi:MAG: YkgJ family cysteine cluster protein [Promethearchaeota archaeon]
MEIEKQLFMEKCNNCGYCCSLDQQGDVLLFPLDLQRIADFFKITTSQLANRYCKVVEYEISVKDVNFEPTSKKSFIPVFALRMVVNHGCPFYDKSRKNCKIYSARPDQCRFFPFIYCILEDSQQIYGMKGNCTVIQAFLSPLQTADPLTPTPIIPINPIETMTEKEKMMEFAYYRALTDPDGILVNKKSQEKWDILSEEDQRAQLLQFYSAFLKN